MKVVIINYTAWQTKLLRPFVVRIAREEFPATKFSNTRRRVEVVIGYNRGKDKDYCSGHAHLNSSRAYINVPNPAYGKPFPVLDFCHLVGHEFGHCKGLEHAQMGLHYGNSCQRGSYTGPHYAWALKLPIPVVKPKKRGPTTEEKRATALRAARAAVVRWERKSKLAGTKLRLWRRRVRTLERRIGASTDAPVAAAACGAPRSEGPPVTD